MELRHLRYFVAVAEELNFRKAAQRLRVAQPALSSQIQDLEHDVGVRLLDRDTGGVRLTDAGAAFLEESRLTLAQSQQAVAAAREAAAGRRGRLNVGHVAPLLMGFMPASLRAFHAKFPEVEVNLIEMTLADQIAGLESGAIQVGFGLGGYLPFPPSLQSRELVRSPNRAVMGRGYRLAKRPKIALADLAREPLLAFSIKKGVEVHADVIRRVFAERGLKPGPIKSIEGAETFRAMLESGMGVSLVAEIGSLSRSPDLIFKPLLDTGPDLVLELSVLWRADQPSLLTTNFVEMLSKLRLHGRRAKKDHRPKAI
jgi:DNA-binding transcriptional LysR family regulator